MVRDQDQTGAKEPKLKQQKISLKTKTGFET